MMRESFVGVSMVIGVDVGLGQIDCLDLRNSLTPLIMESYFITVGLLEFQLSCVGLL